ncbi:hypothetical protein ACQP2P_32460 [Dactylosporangium sp. CA-139114]|uniref:hypothetical protein n=1 Tax=Dactylosporangium sp. CA-139114 TaxID=3239931 RepID=UPI003D95B0EF
MTTFVGPGLDAGRLALQRDPVPVWWRGRSLVMLSGAREHLPPVHLQPVDEPDHPVTGAAGALSLQNTPELLAWARRQGLTVLLPAAELTDALGDKSALPALAAAAGVPLPRTVVLDRPDPARAARLWAELGGGPVVVQRTANNLTGTGTRHAGDVAELADALAAWTGDRLRVTAFVAGTDITVSACVGADETFVSGVSHQLVGVPELTATWGAHCGNQLVDAATLPGEALTRCHAIAAAVGDRLRDRGFRGQFGLDLICDPGGAVWVLELNPRIQSVTSLLSYVEAEHGVLPTPAAHVLTFLGRSAPIVRVNVPRVRPLSQLIVTARHPALVRQGAPAGRYRLGGDRPHRLSASCNGPAPGPDEVLIWPSAKAGDRLDVGDRVLVAMFGRHVAPVGPRRPLFPEAVQALASIEALAVLENGPAHDDTACHTRPATPAKPSV